MRQVISDIVVLKIKDPRVQGVTITEVEMAADLKSAKIYFCTLADGKDELRLEGLEAAQGFIRHQLRAELALKYIPQLSFFYDSSFDNYARIDKILKKLNVSKDDNDPEDSPNS